MNPDTARLFATTATAGPFTDPQRALSPDQQDRATAVETARKVLPDADVFDVLRVARFILTGEGDD